MMLPNDVVNEQHRKTEEAIENVTGMADSGDFATSGSETGQRRDHITAASTVQLEGKIGQLLAELIAAIKNEVRQEVLNELIPLMEAMEKAAKGGNAQVGASPQQAQQPPFQQQMPNFQALQQQAAATMEQRTQELQNMIDQKIAKRRQRMFTRL
jgi:hypothetical protein